MASRFPPSGSNGPPFGSQPITPRSGLSLGAVGGAKGFAAGTTSVLLNFILNYNKGNLQQLQKDIADFQQRQLANNQAIQVTQAHQEQLAKRQQAIDEARQKIAHTAGATAANTLDLLKKQELAAKGQKQFTEAQGTALRSNLQALVNAKVITQQQMQYLLDEQGIRQRLAAATAELNVQTRQGVALEAEKLALQRQQALQQSLLGSAASRVGTLALGVLAGTIGGGIVTGLVLQPIQQAMDAVANGLQDIVDPARHAREGLKDVNSEIDTFIDPGRVSRLEAASKYIQSLGTIGQGLGLDPSKLGQAAALSGISERIQQVNKDLEVQAHLDELVSQAALQQAGNLAKAAAATTEYDTVIQGLTDSFLSEGRARALYSLALQGDATALQILAYNGSTWAQNLEDQGDAAVRAALGIDDLTASIQAYDSYIQNLNQTALDTAISGQVDAEVAAAQALLDGTIAGIRATTETEVARINNLYDRQIERTVAESDARIKQLQRQAQDLKVDPSARTRSLERRLDALNDAGPSKRTQELAASIERLNDAQDKSQYRQQLADLDEQKRQLLLRQRLALTNEQINLDEYAGEDRLIAIDALLARMREQNEVQERFNKLLDIQYQISRGVHREQGETIQDFIQRRAQYYRGLLQQASDLRRQGPEADLEAERDRVEGSLALSELEAKRREVIETRIRKLHLQSLQDQLKASQERDRKELESRRESLQKQLQKSREADQAVLESRRRAIQDEIEKERESARTRIETFNRTRDQIIASRNAQRDRAIAAATTETDNYISNLRARADQAKQWANFSNIQSLNQAISGAQSLGQLQALTGQIAGLNYAMAYLRSSGVITDPAAYSALMTQYARTLSLYNGRLNSFYRNASPPPAPSMNFSPRPGYAEGGFFRAGNFNTPIGKDIRWGDGQGEELGFMFNNKVVQALREQPMQQPLVGTMNFNGSGNDMYKTRDAWRSEVRTLVREELRR